MNVLSSENATYMVKLYVHGITSLELKDKILLFYASMTNIVYISKTITTKAHLVRTTSNLVRVNLSDTAELQVGMADNMRTNTPTHTHVILYSN